MPAPMPETLSTPEIQVLEGPQNPDLAALHQLWLAKRGTRPMPARADFEPAEFRSLLPHIMLVDVLPAPDIYRVRLMGQAMIDFHGRNLTGLTPREYAPPEALARFTALARLIVDGRMPVFRAGRAYWVRDKDFKRFESCHLPLSADGISVNMILGALKFSA